MYQIAAFISSGTKIMIVEDLQILHLSPGHFDKSPSSVHCLLTYLQKLMAIYVAVYCTSFKPVKRKGLA